MDDEGVSFILINDIQYFSVIFSNKKGSFSFHTLFFFMWVRINTSGILFLED